MISILLIFLLISPTVCTLVQEDASISALRCIAKQPSDTVAQRAINHIYEASFQLQDRNRNFFYSDNKMYWLPVYENKNPTKYQTPRYLVGDDLMFNSEDFGAVFVSNHHKIIFVVWPGTTKLWYFGFSAKPDNKIWHSAESGFTHAFVLGARAAVLENNYPLACFDKMDRFPYPNTTQSSVCFYGPATTLRSEGSMVQCLQIAPEGQTATEVWEEVFPEANQTDVPRARIQHAMAGDKRGFWVHGGYDETTSLELADFWYYHAPPAFHHDSSADPSDSEIFGSSYGWHRLPSGPGLCHNCTDPSCDAYVENHINGSHTERCRRSYHSLVPLFDDQDQQHPTVILLFFGQWMNQSLGNQFARSLQKSKAVWQYDVAAGVWTTLQVDGDIPSPRSSVSAVVTVDMQLPSVKMVVRLYGGSTMEHFVLELPQRIGLPLCDLPNTIKVFCKHHGFWDSVFHHNSGVPYTGPCANFNRAKNVWVTNPSFTFHQGIIDQIYCADADNSNNEILDFYPGFNLFRQRNSDIAGKSQPSARTGHQAAVVPGGMLVYGNRLDMFQEATNSETGIDFMYLLVDIMNLGAMEEWTDAGQTAVKSLDRSELLPRVQIKYGRKVITNFDVFLDPLRPVSMRAHVVLQDTMRGLELEHVGEIRQTIEELLEGIEITQTSDDTAVIGWEGATIAQEIYRNQKISIKTKPGAFRRVTTGFIFEMDSQDRFYDAGLNLLSYILETSVPSCGPLGTESAAVNWVPRNSFNSIEVCKCSQKPVEVPDVCIPCYGDLCPDCGPGYYLQYSPITIHDVTDEDFNHYDVPQSGEASDQMGEQDVIAMQSQCFPCPAGRYRDMLDIQGRAFIETCTPCPIGRFQPAVGQTFCKSCTATLDEKNVFWRGNIECPADANGSRPALLAGDGWWRVSPDLHEYTFCPPFGGTSPCLRNGQCVEGHDGLFCGTCIPGYARRVTYGMCVKCAPYAEEVTKMLTTFLFLCIVFIYVWIRALRCVIDENTIKDVVIKIIISHVQMMLCTRFFETSTFSESASLQCTLSEAFGTWWTQDKIDFVTALCYPFLWAAWSLGYAALASCWKRVDLIPGSTSQSNAILSFIIMYFITYDYMLRMLLSIVSIRPPTELDQHWRQKFHPGVDPWSEERIDIWSAAFGCILFFYILFPLILLKCMYDAVKYQGLGSRSLTHSWGFFSSGYESNLWYWEFVVFFRRLCLSVAWAMPIFIDPFQNLRTFSTLALSLLFYGVHIRMRPFDNRANMMMDTLEKDSLVAFMITCVVDSIRTQMENTRQQAQWWLDVILIVAVVLAELRFIFQALILMLRRSFPDSCMKLVPKNLRYHFRPNTVMYNIKTGHLDCQLLHKQERKYLATMLSDIHRSFILLPDVNSVRIGGTFMTAFSAACKAECDIQMSKAARQHEKYQVAKRNAAEMIDDRRGVLKMFSHWWETHKADRLAHKEAALDGHYLGDAASRDYPFLIVISLRHFHPRVMILAGKLSAKTNSFHEMVGTSLSSKETEENKEEDPRNEVQKMLDRVQVTSRNIRHLSNEISVDAEQAVIEVRAEYIFRVHDLAFEWLNLSLPQSLSRGKSLLFKRQRQHLHKKHAALRRSQYDLEQIQTVLKDKLHAEYAAVGGSKAIGSRYSQDTPAEFHSNDLKSLAVLSSEDAAGAAAKEENAARLGMQDRTQQIPSRSYSSLIVATGV